MQVLVTQAYPTLCDPMDCSPPGSSVHGIFPGRDTGVVFAFPSPGNLPDPGMEPMSPALQADSVSTELPDKTTKYSYLGWKIKGIFYTHTQKSPDYLSTEKHS